MIHGEKQKWRILGSFPPSMQTIQKKGQIKLLLKKKNITESHITSGTALFGQNNLCQIDRKKKGKRKFEMTHDLKRTASPV